MFSNDSETIFGKSYPDWVVKWWQSWGYADWRRNRGDVFMVPAKMQNDDTKERSFKINKDKPILLSVINWIGPDLKEAKEETGLKNVTPLSEEIFSLEVLGVDGHMKKGKYVASHMHLNVTYLLCADENEMTHIKADENSGVKWFDLDEAVEASNEPYMKKIYGKLNKKLKDLK